MPTTTFDRTKAPRPGPIATIGFPKFITTALAGGTPIYLVENHAQPLVSISLYLRGGSSSDTAATQGLASFTSELLTKGTTTRTATQIAEQIDFVGGSLSASSSWDSTTISTAVLSRYIFTAIELLADVALNPVFAAEELDRIRTQRLASIKHAKSDAGYLADVVISRSIYKDHPYGFEPGGVEAVIAGLQSDQLKTHYASINSPKNAFFVVAGDVTEDEIVRLLSNAFADWNGDAKPTKVIAPPKESTSMQVKLVGRQQAVQSALRVGHLAISRSDPDYVACYVLNMILGGYFNSRINQNLREKNGFTYGARSYFDARKQTGAFIVSTEVRTEVTSAAIREIGIELERIRTEAVTDEELSMVKQYIIGSFPLSIETPQQVASRVASIVLFALGADYYDVFREAVATLTADDLLRVANTHLHPSKLSIAISGDAKALETELGVFGELEVVPIW